MYSRFFTFFVLVYIKWLIVNVHGHYSMDIYESVKISAGTVMRNPELLKFVPDHLNTKKMYKYAVKRLPL